MLFITFMLKYFHKYFIILFQLSCLSNRGHILGSLDMKAPLENDSFNIIRFRSYHSLVLYLCTAIFIVNIFACGVGALLV